MEQAESKVEATAFEWVASRFSIAAGKLALDDGLYQLLLTPDREMAIPVQMNKDGSRYFKPTASSTTWREGRPTEASVTHQR
jgi:hypothetical protein